MASGVRLARDRYGTSGIDGVSFGPAFGRTDGPFLLTVAYGIHGDTGRQDNDNQVLLQYDISEWSRWERPYEASRGDRTGPAPAGKYFLHTGNTTFGVQNLAYDAHLRRWFLGVYAGAKPTFPNFTLFAVDAATAPRDARLPGLRGERGCLLTLADDGLAHEPTGIRGWHQKADVGIAFLGDGLLYLSVDGASGGQQTSHLTLHRWTGDAATPFRVVDV